MARNPRDLRARFGNEALALLAPLLARAPSDPELHYLAGEAWIAVAEERVPAHLDAQAAARAHEELDAVGRLDPEGARAEDTAVERGLLYMRQGRFADALDEYRRALVLHAVAGPYPVGLGLVEHHGGTGALIHENMAEALMGLGRLDESIAHYHRALEMSPGDRRLSSLPLWGLAVALDRDEQLDKARAAIKQALARDPQMADLDDRDVFFVPEGEKLYYQALGYIERDMPEAAESVLQLYLKTNPRPRFLGRARARLADVVSRLAAPQK